jgi:hypothetical protein
LDALTPASSKRTFAGAINRDGDSTDSLLKQRRVVMENESMFDMGKASELTQGIPVEPGLEPDGLPGYQG